MRDESFQEMLDSIDVESYLDREGIDYRVARGRSGPQVNIRECPVCGSTKWKVYLNAETGVGNCFAGDHPPDENFNKYTFIRAWLGNPAYRTVFEHIRQVSKEMGWRPPRKTSYAVNTDVNELKLPAHHAIPIKGQNLKYLASRGIDLATAQYFHLKYSHTGVFEYKQDGRTMRQDYAKRIIIPIFDLAGNMVSFQGRDITGEAEKKYLFPPGFASTGAHLYNGHNAYGSKRVVMGEGAFDVMAIKLALDADMGLRDIVPIGSFGKHLSHGDPNGQDQLGKLIEMKAAGLEDVTVMWDGEKKALLDAIRAGLLIKGIGLNVRIAVLPADKDPNEVPPDAVRAAYYKAVTVNRANMAKLRMLVTAGRIY